MGEGGSVKSGVKGWKGLRGVYSSWRSSGELQVVHDNFRLHVQGVRTLQGLVRLRGTPCTEQWCVPCRQPSSSDKDH